MPKKAFKDGRAATEKEAEGVADAWDKHERLRQRALSGTALMARVNPNSPVLQPNLKHMSKNHLVLMEIARSMQGRHRLSSDPIEVILAMTMAWYGKYTAAYTQVKDFRPQVWAFRDAWVLHKMFTKLRAKVVRDEKPKDSSLTSS